VSLGETGVSGRAEQTASKAKPRALSLSHGRAPHHGGLALARKKEKGTAAGLLLGAPLLLPDRRRLFYSPRVFFSFLQDRGQTFDDLI
jgi:hypothetical protein